MRQLRRLLSVLVMAVTIVGMSMTAFAQESVSGAGGNGSITIENASKGIVYSIYKVFDAKVNAEGTSVAYSTKNFVDNPYFEKDSVGNISAKKEAYKTDSNEQLSEGAIEWIKENGTKICSETSDGSILKITGLPYGYYYVTSTLKDGGMIMVTSVAKDAQIVDKNSKEPQWTPGNDGNAGGKSIVLDDGKQVKRFISVYRSTPRIMLQTSRSRNSLLKILFRPDLMQQRSLLFLLKKNRWNSLNIQLSRLRSLGQRMKEKMAGKIFMIPGQELPLIIRLC